MAKEDVEGYSRSIEHERGANSKPIGNLGSGGAKAASYRTPKAYPPAHANQNLDTGEFKGDKARSQRAIPVHPDKAGGKYRAGPMDGLHNLRWYNPVTWLIGFAALCMGAMNLWRKKWCLFIGHAWRCEGETDGQVHYHCPRCKGYTSLTFERRYRRRPRS